METVIHNISKALFENNFIKKTEIEIVSYGIEMFIVCVLEIIAIFCLAICFNNFLETIIYLLAFIPVRIYSGGYHAETRLRCFIILLCVFGIFTVINPLQLINCYMGILIAVINFIFVFLWSPLGNGNKPVSKNKGKIYRKRGLILSILEVVIIVSFCIYAIESIYMQAYILGLLTAAISLVAGKIKNTMKGEKQNG